MIAMIADATMEGDALASLMTRLYITSFYYLETNMYQRLKNCVRYSLDVRLVFA